MHFNTMEHSPLIPFPTSMSNNHLSPCSGHLDLHTDYSSTALNTSNASISSEEIRVREENWRERVNFLQQSEDHEAPIADSPSGIPHLDVRSPTRSTAATSASPPESLVAQYNREYCSIGKGEYRIYCNYNHHVYFIRFTMSGIF